MEPIYVISHCLLNSSARVKGIKKPDQIDTKDKKIIQLPCPETVYFGVNRRENTKTQFDFPKYRRFCQKLFRPYADMIEMFQKDGHPIIIIGVAKSPTCGVLAEKGVFIEEIEKELKKRRISYEI